MENTIKIIKELEESIHYVDLAISSLNFAKELNSNQDYNTKYTNAIYQTTLVKDYLLSIQKDLLSELGKQYLKNIETIK